MTKPNKPRQTPRKPSEKVLARTFFEHKLEDALAGVSREDRFLIGVSGGRDSVALLTGLAALGFKNIIVAHLNHGLRGEAADSDEQFVRALAARLELPFECARSNIAQVAKAEKKSIETAARQARYAFFAKVARQHACTALFTGHHADDQVETFLLNLFRGAARAGLGGMKLESIQQLATDSDSAADEEAHAISLKILRPMLGIWREEIDQYAAAKQLAFCEDSSNASPEHTRNRVRHELIPKLKEIFGRDVRALVARTADILQTEEEWLAGLMNQEPEQSTLSTPELKLKTKAEQRRIIHRWLKSHEVPDTGFEQVEAVRSLLDGKRAKINLPGNWFARRRQKKLFLERARL